MLFGQGLEFGDGVDITSEDGLTIVYDNFTGQTVITVDTSSIDKPEVISEGGLTIPIAVGETGLFGYYYDWAILFYIVEESQFLKIEDGDHLFPLLADEERILVSAELVTEYDEDVTYQTLIFDLLESEWDVIRSAQKVRYRVAGNATNISTETLNQMTKISNKVSELKNDLESETDENESHAPYELKWEGDIDRAPMVQSLPGNVSNSESVITVRFEVRPDGTVGRVIPLRKMGPELEREVMSTLRTWRFSRLPSGSPQQTQWGTITFRFVFE
jgi:TonB family protein